MAAFSCSGLTLKTTNFVDGQHSRRAGIRRCGLKPGRFQSSRITSSDNWQALASKLSADRASPESEIFLMLNHQAQGCQYMFLALCQKNRFFSFLSLNHACSIRSSPPDCILWSRSLKTICDIGSDWSSDQVVLRSNNNRFSMATRLQF